jgi:diadenosine tetraphosphatase ApaH/serine/threonine PP2A family protein phosphatase
MEIVEALRELEEKYSYPDRIFPVERSELEELLEESRQTLSREHTLLRVEASKVLFIGDTHGDLESTLSALRRALELTAEKVVFLGDYVDRGPFQLGNISVLLELKRLFPGWIYLLRGNHESRRMNEWYGFLRAVRLRYGDELYSSFEEVFASLSLALLLNGKVLAVHGGIPLGLESVDEIDEIPKNLKDEDLERSDLALQLLWNDPSEGIEDYADSPRGWGIYLFGKKVFEDFMSRSRLELLVRGHEPVEDGVRYMFNNRLATVFSCRFYGISPAALLISGDRREIIHL